VSAHPVRVRSGFGQGVMLSKLLMVNEVRVVRVEKIIIQGKRPHAARAGMSVTLFFWSVESAPRINEFSTLPSLTALTRRSLEIFPRVVTLTRPLSGRGISGPSGCARLVRETSASGFFPARRAAVAEAIEKLVRCNGREQRAARCRELRALGREPPNGVSCYEGASDQ
jgi:hypothetical protein